MRDLWDGQFLAQCSGGGSVRGHAGDDLVINAIGQQAPDLFGNRALKRRITGMHPRDIFAPAMCGDNLGMGVV